MPESDIFMPWPQFFAYVGLAMWVVVIGLYVIGYYLRRSKRDNIVSLNEREIEEKIRSLGKAQIIMRIAVIYMTIRITVTFALFDNIPSDKLIFLITVILPGLFVIKGFQGFLHIAADNSKAQSG